MSKYDLRDHNKWIRDTITLFYEAASIGNRLEIYSFTSTAFQKRVSLNYFLIHEKYGLDFGYLMEVNDININKENHSADANITIKKNGKIVQQNIPFIMDFGGWKIDDIMVFE